MSINNELLSAIMMGMDIDRGMATAGASLVIWNKISRKLSPLLGPGSASLLFTRSLDANRSAFPWLPAADPLGGDISFQALETCLLRRSPEEILTCTRALLDTYVDLVTTLIGARLTNQFLRSAFPADDVDANRKEKAE